MLAGIGQERIVHLHFTSAVCERREPNIPAPAVRGKEHVGNSAVAEVHDALPERVHRVGCPRFDGQRAVVGEQIGRKRDVAA